MIDEATYHLFLALECKPDFTIERSKCERYDSKTGKRILVEKDTLDAEAIIKSLGVREVNDEFSGRGSRETIRIEWNRPLYTASAQDKTDADIIIWRGSRWRVYDVMPKDCTWRALAIRIEEKECHDTKPSHDETSVHIIGGGRV